MESCPELTPDCFPSGQDLIACTILLVQWSGTHTLIIRLMIIIMHAKASVLAHYSFSFFYLLDYSILQFLNILPIILIAECIILYYPLFSDKILMFRHTQKDKLNNIIIDTQKKQIS